MVRTPLLNQRRRSETETAQLDHDLTPETIRLAYQLFVGRDPESEQMLQHALTYGTVERLRAAFFRSPEFRGICQSELRVTAPPQPLPHAPASPLAVPARVPLDAPPLEVEWNVDEATASALLSHIRDTWTRLGIEQPHWSVLSAEQFRPGRIEANEADFFASGANDLAQLVAIMRRNGVTPESLPRVFEFGCGIGRVTAHLARAFREVTVCDVSASHMAIAQDKVYDSGARNLTFRLVDSGEFGMLAPFDLWFSRIVLQHNPPPIMAMILRRAFGLLAPGGLAVFQVPTYAVGYRFRISEYLAGLGGEGQIEMHVLPQAVVFQLTREAGCDTLEVLADSSAGPATTWNSSIFVVRKRRSA